MGGFRRGGDPRFYALAGAGARARPRPADPLARRDRAQSRRSERCIRRGGRAGGRPCALVVQRHRQMFRQHRHPVLAALVFANQDRPSFEIDGFVRSRHPSAGACRDDSVELRPGESEKYLVAVQEGGLGLDPNRRERLAIDRQMRHERLDSAAPISRGCRRSSETTKRFTQSACPRRGVRCRCSPGLVEQAHVEGRIFHPQKFGRPRRSIATGK